MLWHWTWVLLLGIEKATNWFFLRSYHLSSYWWLRYIWNVSSWWRPWNFISIARDPTLRLYILVQLFLEQIMLIGLGKILWKVSLTDVGAYYTNWMLIGRVSSLARVHRASHFNLVGVRLHILVVDSLPLHFVCVLISQWRSTGITHEVLRRMHTLCYCHVPHFIFDSYFVTQLFHALSLLLHVFLPLLLVNLVL